MQIPSTNQVEGNDEASYDQHAGFYHNNIINSLILFALTRNELNELAAPTFDPLFELESELDYAYLPLLFETVFRNKLIDNRYKSELLDFKQLVDGVPSEIWDWNYLEEDCWKKIRETANSLLDKLNVQHRTYTDYHTIYNKEGNIIKQGWLPFR